MYFPRDICMTTFFAYPLHSIFNFFKSHFFELLPLKPSPAWGELLELS